MPKAPYRPPETSFSLGLADWLGATAGLVALVLFPGLTDPLTGPKLLVLSVGAFAALPSVIMRWRLGRRPQGALLIPVAAAAALVVWGLISAVGSGAPWSVSLFGWWGRGDGWLALASVAILLVAASTLDRSEIKRVITWLLWFAAVIAAIGLLEAVGIQLIPDTYPGVDATLGNPNFAAGYAAIMALLALGRALEAGREMRVRVGSGVLAAALAAMAYLTGSLQGPAALAAGVAAAAVLWVLAYRGARRILLLVLAGVGVAGGLVLLGLSLVGVGPLTVLWSDFTVEIRQKYWLTSIAMMLGEPVFGTGPDGFARYVSEYRPESYIELLGPVRRVSAGHNIALQFGATLGIIGLLLWLVLMVGLLAILLIRVSRAQIEPVILVVAVAGAWVAYLTQGMVSIDMVPVLTMGWLVTGLLIASLRPPPNPPAEPAEGKKKKRPAGLAVRPQGAPAGVAIGVGAAVALVPLILVSLHISAVNAVSNVNSFDEARAVLTNPMTPCPLRVNLAQVVLQSDTGPAGQDLVLEAYEIDPRCAPMVSFATEIALVRGDIPLLNEVTTFGLRIDPLLSTMWLARAEYELAVGNIDAAKADLAEAQRLDALYPDLQDAAPPNIDAQLADLKERIAAAGG